MELKDFGYHYFDEFMKNNDISVLPDSYLGHMMLTNAENGVCAGNYSNLLNLSVAVEALIDRDMHISWLIDNLKALSTSPYTNMHEQINLNSKVAAELIAGGLLAESFNELKPLPEAKGDKTPDFKLFDSGYAEVYCPQTSQQNITVLNEQKKIQKGKSVVLAFSYPLTGQTAGAKKYPANKVIDRVINYKREKDQAREDATNLLWLDLTHGFDVYSSDTQPLKTVLHAGTAYTGSFGVWHAFYGKAGESVFASERTELKYLDLNFDSYQQQKEGLFRQRNQLHGAILLLKDGIIFFENPWSSRPLTECVKKKISQLHRFRANFSWFQCGTQQLHSSVIDNELVKINWLYQRNG
ncbi:hypothetical protein [Pseudoalteromonas sp. M8]|uniref:hypothetical protein n=1 Tax=Pseudoalteromonas sp. M8 TaxID=2692624 RepID=UPI001BA9B37A|nr:hypothetical protein [Pseudoalteromonas sp. M8]QUI70700.1 hypothetical protein GSF13_13465 [Pseudoalteromonas sp. M8]